jgi:hypothetical protein
MADFPGKIHASALHLSQNGRLFCISTAALITNIPLTSWGNEMKFTEKIEKELIYQPFSRKWWNLNDQSSYFQSILKYNSLFAWSTFQKRS